MHSKRFLRKLETYYFLVSSFLQRKELSAFSWLVQDFTGPLELERLQMEIYIQIICKRGCRWKSDFKAFPSVYFLANVLGLALLLGVFGINPALAIQTEYLRLKFRFLYDKNPPTLPFIYSDKNFNCNQTILLSIKKGKILLNICV